MNGTGREVRSKVLSITIDSKYYLVERSKNETQS